VRCEAEQPAGEAPPGRRELRAGGARTAVLGVVATRSGPRDGWPGAASERRGWRRRKRMALTPAAKPTPVAASRCGATEAAAPLDTGEDQAGAAALLSPRSRPARESTAWAGCARGTAFRWTTLLLAALFPSLPYLHMCCLQMQMHMSAGDGLSVTSMRFSVTKMCLLLLLIEKKQFTFFWTSRGSWTPLHPSLDPAWFRLAHTRLLAVHPPTCPCPITLYSSSSLLAHPGHLQPALLHTLAALPTGCGRIGSREEQSTSGGRADGEADGSEMGSTAPGSRLGALPMQINRAQICREYNLFPPKQSHHQL
jgi:hypothetical protein